MASAIFSYLKNTWPFCLLKDDDLKASNRLVSRLAISEQTKQFVFAIRDSDSHVVVYILAAQNLSEQSAIDADHLIKKVRPNAVIVSVGPSDLPEIQVEEKCLTDNQVDCIPTSSLGVLKRCLFEKIKKEQYDSFAGCQVLQAIFGIGFYGHFMAAKRAAETVDSHFLLLESPYESTFSDTSASSEPHNESSVHLQGNNLLPGKVTPLMNSSSRRLFISDALQSNMVKSLIPSLHLIVSNSIAQQDQEGIPKSNYQAPPFAQSVYSLLVDLHRIFTDLPAMGSALSSAQKMLVDVNEGVPIDTKTLSIVQNFRIAVETLRIALNTAARRSISEADDTMNTTKSKIEFYELPTEEKCHVLFAQAIKRQARNFGSVVAVVDTARLTGLRRHWNTAVPPEVADLANHCITHYCDDSNNVEEILSNNNEKKKILTDKPVVAFGAGATALLGVSSISKAMPASSLIKVATFHVPKIGLLQLKRTVSLGLSKLLFPSKLLATGLTTGTKTSTLTFAASAEKIRAVTHSVIATAERSSLFAIRSSFYEIMRKRTVRPVGYAPWLSFACSMGACAGLLTYGDGIECAAESFPSVSMIASLGRGLQSLQQASQEVKQSRAIKLHETLQYLVQSVKRS